MFLFTMHEQNPAQFSMLRICNREKSVPDRKTLSQGSKPPEAHFQKCSHSCSWLPALSAFQIAGGCLHELMAGPERRLSCYNAPLKAMCGRPKLLDWCRKLLQWPHRGSHHNVSSLLMPQQRSACAYTPSTTIAGAYSAAAANSPHLPSPRVHYCRKQQIVFLTTPCTCMPAGTVRTGKDLVHGQLKHHMPVRTSHECNCI